MMELTSSTTKNKDKLQLRCDKVSELFWGRLFFTQFIWCDNEKTHEDRSFNFNFQKSSEVRLLLSSSEEKQDVQPYNVNAEQSHAYIQM